jgi:hypothetical protein
LAGLRAQGVLRQFAQYKLPFGLALTRSHE